MEMLRDVFSRRGGIIVLVIALPTYGAASSRQYLEVSDNRTDNILAACVAVSSRVSYRSPSFFLLCLSSSFVTLSGSATRSHHFF